MERPLKVLIIVSNRENYIERLYGHQLIDGRFIEVEQAPWVDVEVCSYPDSLLVRIKPQNNPLPNTNQNSWRTFEPDFVLLRSFVLGSPGHDWREKMNGFFHHNIPTLNSLFSFAYSIHKPMLWGKLREIQEILPEFPLISQTYYSAPAVAGFVDGGFPAVLKMGSASQGVGKMRIQDNSGWKDALSMVQMSTSGFTSEPMVEWKGDVRVQKIGSHYRAIRRKKIGEGDVWKANEGVGVGEEEVEVEERWREWADVCGEVLGMEILGLDILEEEGEEGRGGMGKEYVLEVNSSSIGFSVNNRQEDFEHIVELLLQYLEKRSLEVRRKRVGRAIWEEVQKKLGDGGWRVEVSREEGYERVRELGRRLREKRRSRMQNGKNNDFISFDETDLKTLRPKMIFSKTIEEQDAQQLQLVDLTVSIWLLSFSSCHQPQTPQESHLLSPLLQFVRDIFRFGHPLSFETDIENAFEMMEGLLGVLVRRGEGREGKGKEREENDEEEKGKGKEREEKEGERKGKGKGKKGKS